MVRKLAKFFAYFIFFMAALMFFTPKESLYYLMEKEMKNHSLLISLEELKDRGFFLDIHNANISLKSIESATVDKTSIKIFGIYNSLNVDGIELSSTASSFVPLHIEHIEVNYNIFNPLAVSVKGYGDFGEMRGSFDILKRSLHLNLIASKIMLKDYKSTLRNLKKNKNGEYEYDKNI